MFNRKTPLPFLRKASFLFAIGSLSVAYSELEPFPMEEIKASVKKERSETYLDNVQVTLPGLGTHRGDRGTINGYSGNLGLIDYFKVWERHHAWIQCGALRDLTLESGAGIGYRYLLVGKNPNEDIFFGGYVFGSFKRYQGNLAKVPIDTGGHVTMDQADKGYNRRLPWSGGFEIGMRWLQLTTNFYGLYPICEDQVKHYREGGSGWSVRLSAYPWSKIRSLFVFGARTSVNKVRGGQKSDSRTATNFGLGARWAIPHLDIETKMICDNQRERKFLGMNCSIAAQFNFLGDKDYTIRSARHAVHEPTQRYQPDDYFLNSPQT